MDKLDVGGVEKVTLLLANILAQKDHDSGLSTIIDKGELIENIDADVKYFKVGNLEL